MQKEEQLTLKLLNKVEEKSDISQRHLASELGIALGLTNSYLNRCARKGLIRIRGKSPRRYLYFLTPKGFTEKAKLSSRYLANSLVFYRTSADEFRGLFSKYDQKKSVEIILSGLSDLAEIAILVSRTTNNIKIVGIYDQKGEESVFHQVPVFDDLSRFQKSDIAIVTCLDHPVENYNLLVEKFTAEKVYLPRVLGIKP